MSRSARSRHHRHRYYVFVEAGGKYSKQIQDAWAHPYEVEAENPAQARAIAKKHWKRDYVDTKKIPPKVTQTDDITKQEEQMQSRLER